MQQYSLLFFHPAVDIFNHKFALSMQSIAICPRVLKRYAKGLDLKIIGNSETKKINYPRSKQVL